MRDDFLTTVTKVMDHLNLGVNDVAKACDVGQSTVIAWRKGQVKHISRVNLSRLGNVFGLSRTLNLDLDKAILNDWLYIHGHSKIDWTARYNILKFHGLADYTISEDGEVHVTYYPTNEEEAEDQANDISKDNTSREYFGYAYKTDSPSRTNNTFFKDTEDKDNGSREYVVLDSFEKLMDCVEKENTKKVIEKTLDVLYDELERKEYELINDIFRKYIKEV